MDKLLELQNIVNKLREGSEILIFKIKVSPALSDYLKKAHHNRFNLREARDILNSMIPTRVNPLTEILQNRMDHFEKIYGINALKLAQQVYIELDDLCYIVSALVMMYHFMLDHYNDTFQGDISKKKNVSVKMTGANFNCDENEIVVNNPLRYDKKKYFEVYNELLIPTNNNMALHGLIEKGYFHQFLSLIEQ
jgi:hypothetical protein